MKMFLELVKYGFFGCITTGINLILFFVLENAGIFYIAANSISYIVAVIINYIFNQRFVFQDNYDRNKNDKKIQFIKFVVIRMACLAVDNGLFYLLVSILTFNIYASRIVLTIFLILVTYSINRRFVFNKRSKNG